MLIGGKITYAFELARMFNINERTLLARLRRGWPLEAALIADVNTRWNEADKRKISANRTVKQYIKTTILDWFAEQEQKTINRSRSKKSDNPKRVDILIERLK